jgi:hypothetical protein
MIEVADGIVLITVHTGVFPRNGRDAREAGSVYSLNYR